MPRSCAAAPRDVSWALWAEEAGRSIRSGHGSGSVNSLVLALEDFRSRDAGSRIRDWYLVDALTSRGPVTVLTFTPRSPLPRRWEIDATFHVTDPRASSGAVARAAIDGAMYHVHRYDFSAHPSRQALASTAFDVVYVSQLYGMSHLDAVLDATATQHATVVWDTHNFDPDVWQTRSHHGDLASRTYARVMAPRANRLITRATAQADLVVACTDADFDAWSHIAGETPVSLVPNAADIEGWAKVRSTVGDPSRYVLFGSLKQQSTADGAAWFLRSVWPGVLRRLPDARVTLAGRRPHASLARLAADTPGVDLVPDPDDLRPIVGAAGTVVVPQVWGTGSKLKMIEALASGRPVVASPAATVGIPADALHFVTQVEDIEAWTEALVDAANTPRTATDIERLTAILEETSSWRRSQQALLEAIDGVRT